MTETAILGFMQLGQEHLTREGAVGGADRPPVSDTVRAPTCQIQDNWRRGGKCLM